MKSLIVELPGLLQNVSETDLHKPLEQQQFPLFSLLLSKADKINHHHTEYVFLSELEYQGALNPALALPFTTISPLQANTYKYWFRADPMELLTDIATIHLKGNRHLKFSDIQLQSLQAKISSCISHLDANYYLVSATEGYLGCNDFSEVEFSSPLQALGEDQTQVMATGKDAAHWKGLMTEIQMSLFGEATPSKQTTHSSANSIHFWGKPNTPIIEINLDSVITDSNLLKGLAASAGVKIKNFEELNYSEFFEQTTTNQSLQIIHSELFWLQKQGLYNEWLNRLKDIEKNHLPKIISALESKTIDTLFIFTDNQTGYKISKKQLRKFWRRIKPLKYFIEEIKL